MNNDYYYDVRDDVMSYICENPELLEGHHINGLDGIRADIWEEVTYLQEALENEDAITGNASGSYFCNSWKARQKVMDNIDLLRDAAEGLGFDAADIGEMFLNEAFEAMDVILRVYVLPHSICAALEEIIAAYDGESESQHAQRIAQRL